MWTNSSDCSARTGLTLIEVAVSLALLSTLLVGILVASQRHAEQIRRSRKMLDVVRWVDNLLYERIGGGGVMPPDAAGVLAEEEGLVWTTRLVSRRHRQSLGVDVIRLEVFDRREGASSDPVMSVDLAVPSSEWPPAGE